MGIVTTQVHEKRCDRCGEKVPKKNAQVIIDAGGVRELPETVSLPTALDFCTPCKKSANLWWTGPERRAK